MWGSPWGRDWRPSTCCIFTGDRETCKANGAIRCGRNQDTQRRRAEDQFHEVTASGRGGGESQGDPLEPGRVAEAETGFRTPPRCGSAGCPSDQSPGDADEAAAEGQRLCQTQTPLWAIRGGEDQVISEMTGEGRESLDCQGCRPSLESGKGCLRGCKDQHSRKMILGVKEK